MNNIPQNPDKLHEAYCARIASAEKLEENHLYKAAERVRASAEIIWQRYQEAKMSQQQPHPPIVTQSKSEQLAQVTARNAKDYSLKYRHDLLQMQRDIQEGRRPRPKNDLPSGF